jgi:two-component system phosphate regulon sensor histidine kinase PhoR
MSKKTTIIFFVLVGYIVAQFLWWEVLLVKQSNELISVKQNLAALSSSDNTVIMGEINALEHKKALRLYMTVGEGTVFLFILLFGVNQVRKSMKKENELATQQNNFILSVSHELKTPIASTKLQLQTLLKHELDREKQIQLLNNALKETDRLHKLVDNVLLVTQVENKNTATDLKTINLSELIEDTVGRYFEMYIENKWLKLNVAPNTFIQGDKELLPSLIINLIENAIKYSYETLDVTLNLKTDISTHFDKLSGVSSITSNQVLLEVVDSGCGINDSEKQKIFEKFYRSGNEETRKTKGTGIGLFIVKQICNMHQAAIIVNDNKPCGSRFKISFDKTLS